MSPLRYQGEVVRYSLAYVNPSLCGADNGRVLGYESLAAQFYEEVRQVTVASGTVEAFIERSLERAQKLDRGERLPSEMTMTFEDPSDLLRVLSAQRVRVLHAVRARPTPVSELAGTLRRDRKAVRQDVSLLESFGLVKTREEPNPGHGRRRVVEPHAAKYQLVATI
jgi:predicted transcriptional regulator